MTVQTIESTAQSRRDEAYWQRESTLSYLDYYSYYSAWSWSYYAATPTIAPPRAAEIGLAYHGSVVTTSRPMAMVDDVSAKVLSDLGHHGYEHYGAGRVDAVADGLFVRTGFWTVPDLASEITRAAAVTTIDTIRSVPHVDALLSQAANGFWWVINDGVDHLANFSTGFSDTLTVGGTRWVRGKFGVDYIDYDSLAYTGGQVTGAVVGFGLGFTGSAAAGGVLYSVARGYNAIETTVAVTQATRNLISGERNLGDALAFAPALGVAAKQLTKISGLLPRAGNAARGAVDAIENWRLGGTLYNPGKLDSLSGYLNRRGFKLRLDGDDILPPNVAAGFDGVKKEIILRRNATELEVFHELSHLRQFQQIGPDAYNALSRIQKEQFVFDLLDNSKKRWYGFSEAERLSAINYILRVGGVR
jgi:hypothetical protein